MSKEIMKIWVSKDGDIHMHICIPSDAYDILEKAMCALTSKTKFDDALKEAYEACGVGTDKK